MTLIRIGISIIAETTGLSDGGDEQGVGNAIKPTPYPKNAKFTAAYKSRLVMKAKYVNPFTDFGFKKIFGEEASKPVLIDFLTSLLPESNIIDLTFEDKDKLGQTEDDRKAVYEIYCQNNSGEKIIVELQKAKQNYFKDRTIYYSTFPIQEQAEKGEWNYQLKSVYCVGILDFAFEHKKEAFQGEVIHTVQLKDQNNQLF